MSGLLKETGELVQATKDGQLDRRGNAAAFAGGWGQLVDGVNQLITAFVGQSMLPPSMWIGSVKATSRRRLPMSIMATSMKSRTT